MTEVEEILKAAAEQRLYLVFAGADYYPSGGAADYIGRVACSTDTQAIAMGKTMAQHHATAEAGWWQLARLTPEGHLSIVEEGSQGGYREMTRTVSN